MVGETLGTIRGQMILDVKQALNSYTQARQAHISTVTALATGAGAMQASGAVIAGVGAAMVAGFMVALDAASEFERRLDYFSAVSNSTQAEYDAIRLKALELGADTRYSANEIAESFIELGKSGIAAQDIINGIGEGVANLGAAADIDLTSAANIITSAVATFQLGADQAVMVADRLAGAANASIVDVQDLGVSLKYAGGVAASLGVPFEDLNTALAILGVNGIKGSTAGTSLRQILLGLNGSTPKATAALKDLGIITEDGTNRFYNMNGSAKSLAEVFQILQDATAGMTDQQKTATMQQIFAVRALPSLIALTREGAAGFDEMAAAIEKTTALDVASQRLDNLAGDVEYLRGEFDTLLVQSGSNFLGFARLIVQGLEQIVVNLNKLPAWAQTAIGSFVIIGGIILVLVGTFGILASSVLNMINLALRLGPAVKFLGTMFTALRTALSAATAAQWGFNIASIANPIGIIIALIVLFIAEIALLIIYWEDVTKFFQDNQWALALFGLLQPLLAIPIMIDSILKSAEALGITWDKIWAGIKLALDNTVKFITQAVTNVGNVLFSIFVQPWINAYNFITGLWTTLVIAGSNFVKGLLGFISQIPEKVGQFFSELPGKIGFAIGFVLGSITRVFLNVGTWLATNVPKIIDTVVNFFAQLPGRILAFILGVVNTVVTGFTNAWNWLLVNVPLIIAAVVTFFQELPGKIIQFFIDLYNGAVAWMTQFLINAIVWAQNFIGSVVAFFRNLPTMIATFFRQIVTNVIKFFTDAYNNAIRIAQNIFNGIRDALLGLPGLVSGIFTNVINAVKNAISGAVKAVTDFAAGLWNGFKKGLGIHSPSYIEKAMWAITDVVGTEANRMKNQVKTLQTLGNGITEVGNNLSFGTGVTSLNELYKTVAAAKALDLELSGQSAKLGVEATHKLAVDGVREALKDLKVENNFDVDINNPTAEPASTSLPGAIRAVKTIVGEDD